MTLRMNPSQMLGVGNQLKYDTLRRVQSTHNMDSIAVENRSWRDRPAVNKHLRTAIAHCMTLNPQIEVVPIEIRQQHPDGVCIFALCSRHGFGWLVNRLLEHIAQLCACLPEVPILFFER